jgi:peptidoglycan/xylan/chitin deacetylase (PgdA/CDA1 family)
MRRVTHIAKRLLLPQLVVGVATLCVFCGGLAASSASQPAPRPRFIIRQAATPHVQHVSTVVPVDCAKVACFALTFDDGPDGVLTPQILDILDHQNVRATFFVLGNRVQGHEAILRRMYKSGHEIGNHSWDHPHLTELSPEQVEAQVNGTQAAIMRAGVPAPTLFRPPYGEFNDAVLAHVPLTVIRWNIDPEDWNPKKYQQMIEHVATHAKPGGMVILHDTEPTTAAALDQLINQLKSQQYALVTVDELLDLPTGKQGVFYGR